MPWLLLGVTTDTQDTTGTVLKETPVVCEQQAVRDCIASFVGERIRYRPCILL